MEISSSTYTVGWICALSTEYVAARQFLDEEHDKSSYIQENGDNNTYTFGSMGKHKVVIAVMPNGEYGTTTAATVARDMARSFTSLRVCLMVGIAGGAPTFVDIRLGDVVVGCPGRGRGGVFQYDYGKTLQDCEFEYTGHHNQPPQLLLTAVADLRARVEEQGHNIQETIDRILMKAPRLRRTYARPSIDSDRLFRSDITHSLKRKADNETVSPLPEHLIPREPRTNHDDNPCIHYGLIASANQLMKDALLRNRLAERADVLCFEMEAAGLSNHFPCLVIRGICDYSDSHKNNQWQGYAAMTAAAYARLLLGNISPSQVEKESSVQKVLLGISSSIEEVSVRVKSMVDMQQSGQYKDVVSWLNAPDPSTNHSFARQHHEPNTGTWLTASKQYQNWSEGVQRHLWLFGKAGCGKTILLYTAIEEIRALCQGSTRIGIAMFYLTFSDKSKQSLESLLRSMIVQLASEEQILAYFSAGRQKGTSPPGAVELERILSEILHRSYDIVFLLLDAIDECPEQDDLREQLLQGLERLCHAIPHLQILATSRETSDIRDAMVTLKANPVPIPRGSVNADIRAYVTTQISRSSKLSRWNGETQSLVKDTIADKADGMFRWAYCQLQELKRLKSSRPSYVQKALTTLPDTLDETYERMLTSIEEDLRDEALVLLRWIAYSERPMSLGELVVAATIDSDSEADVQEDDQGDISDTFALLSDLIAIEDPEDSDSDQTDDDRDEFDELEQPRHIHEDTRIRLMHFSVKEYLESIRILEGPAKVFHLDARAGHMFLTHSCLTYLYFYSYSEEKTTTGNWRERREDTERFHLLDYATSSWAYHARLHGSRNVDREIDFLNCESVKEDCLWIANPEKRYPPDLRSCLYDASAVGLLSVVEELINIGVDVNFKSGHHDARTALVGASVFGHTTVLRRLLGAGATVDNALDSDVNALRASFEDGSSSAVRSGEVIALLLDAGFDANGGALEGTVYVAAHPDDSYDHLYSFLVARGAKPDRLDILREMRLDDHAARIGQMLDFATEVRRIPQRGTVLGYACEFGRHELVPVLIRAGADVKAQTGPWGHPLQLAGGVARYETVKALLNGGADANNQGGVLGIPTQAASVGLLVDHSLGWAGAFRKSIAPKKLEMIKFLISAGADVNASGGLFGSALQGASWCGGLDIVKVLLSAGADVNLRGGFFGSPLQAAIEGLGQLTYPEAAHLHECIRLGDTTAVVESLLNAGADPNAGDGDYGPPLQAASRLGNLEVVRMLVDAEADVNAKGGRYGSAVRAARFGRDYGEEQCKPSGEQYDQIVQELFVAGAEDDGECSVENYTTSESEDGSSISDEIIASERDEESLGEDENATPEREEEGLREHGIATSERDEEGLSEDEIVTSESEEEVPRETAIRRRRVTRVRLKNPGKRFQPSLSSE